MKVVRVSVNNIREIICSSSFYNSLIARPTPCQQIKRDLEFILFSFSLNFPALLSNDTDVVIERGVQSLLWSPD